MLHYIHAEDKVILFITSPCNNVSLNGMHPAGKAGRAEKGIAVRHLVTFNVG